MSKIRYYKGNDMPDGSWLAKNDKEVVNKPKPKAKINFNFSKSDECGLDNTCNFGAHNPNFETAKYLKR